MKKTLMLLLAAVLALSATASAATYAHDDDIYFEYDDTAFEVVEEDFTDDEALVVLDGRNEAWGQTYVRVCLRELRDGEAAPEMADFAELPGVEVTQDAWGGYKNVFMYTLDNEDGTSQHFFIAPIADDDGEVEDVLTVEIGVTAIKDEAIAMQRDDLISAVVDSLRIDD